MKILVADDHAIFRLGLKRVLEEVPDVRAVGEAESANRALERIREEHWDVLILDLNIPGETPLEVLEIIKAERPELPVLILSMYPEEHYALPTLKGGAAGYVAKANAPDQLVPAIRKAVAGETYLSPTVRKKLDQHLKTRPAETVHELLSDREYSVLCAITTGKSLTEIAEELCLSTKTVMACRACVRSKLGMRRDTDLAHYALQHRSIA